MLLTAAFCVSLSWIGQKYLPELLASLASRRLRIIKCNKFFAKFFRNLNGNTKSAILGVTYVWRHTAHTWALAVIAMDKESIFRQLKWSLQAMTCSGDVQIQLFPDFVAVSDEIVLDFDHWRQVAEGNYNSEFTKGQSESLVEIDKVIDNISSHKEEIWSDDSLRTHQLWDDLRKAGLKALNEFHWNSETPPTDRSTYVRG